MAAAVDEEIDIDWLVTTEDLMPVKIIRGRSPCLSTLDFAASSCDRLAWYFSNDSHVYLAWQAIRQVQPGLIIGGEAFRDANSREHA